MDSHILIFNAPYTCVCTRGESDIKHNSFVAPLSPDNCECGIATRCRDITLLELGVARPILDMDVGDSISILQGHIAHCDCEVLHIIELALVHKDSTIICLVALIVSREGNRTAA